MNHPVCSRSWRKVWHASQWQCNTLQDMSQHKTQSDHSPTKTHAYTKLCMWMVLLRPEELLWCRWLNICTEPCKARAWERYGQGGAFLPWAVLTQHNNASDVELAEKPSVRKYNIPFWVLRSRHLGIKYGLRQVTGSFWLTPAFWEV